MLTPRDFGAKGGGADDTVPLDLWCAAGGGSLGSPTDTWRYVMSAAHPGLRGGANFRIEGSGKLLVSGGWPSGYSLCAAGDWRTPTPGWRLDGTQGACLVLDGPGPIGVPRKGIGYTNLSDMVNDHFGVYSNAKSPKGTGDSFASEFRGGTNCLIKGQIIRHDTGQVGADPIHFSPLPGMPCRDIRLENCDLSGSDDPASATGEAPASCGGTLERLTLQNCILRAKGFSSFKALIQAAGWLGATAISDFLLKDIALNYCRLEVELGLMGPGNAVLAKNFHPDVRSLIDGFTILGGQTNVTVLKGGLIGDACMDFLNVLRLSITNHTFRHFHRTAIRAVNCPDAQIIGCDINSDDPRLVDAHGAPLRRPIAAHEGIPVIDLRGCGAGAKVDTKLILPGWAKVRGYADQPICRVS